MNMEQIAEDLISDLLSTEEVEASPVKEGVNSSYYVTSGDSAYFVKFGTEAGERIVSESFTYKVLDDVAELPVPQLTDSGEVKGLNYLITEWIEDSSVKYGVDDEISSRASRDLGVLLAIMHEQVTVKKCLLGFDEERQRDWEDFYRNWLIHNAEDVKNKYNSIGSRIVECAHNADIPSATKLTLSPLDFHSGNVLFRDDNIVALVDFERCYGGDPQWSLETSKKMVECNTAGSMFSEGYRSVRDIETKPVYELAGLCREMRTAHMIYPSPEDHVSRYSKEIDDIMARLF